MKSRKYLKSLKRVIKIVLFLLITIMGYYGISGALIAHGFQLDTDGWLSETAYKDLFNLLEQQVKACSSVNKIRNHVVKKFPLLSEVRVRVMPHQNLWVRVKCESPLFILNDNFLVLDHKKIVPRGVYQEELIKALPHIKATSFDPGSSDYWLDLYYDFLKALPYKVLDQFHILIKNQDEIELFDISGNAWKILATNKTRFSNEIMNGYVHIQKEHGEIFGNKCVDMRFKDMMIFGKS